MEDNKQAAYKLQPDELYSVFQTSPQGLNLGEALNRQKTYGKNLIKTVKKKPVWRKLLKNFTTLMAILLWVGGIIAIAADMLQLGVAIWLVNIINGVFSFWQEFQAEKATDALKKLLPSYVRIIRDGNEQQILAEDLVPGDILLVEEGDKISADARLIYASDLQINQSALTGESNPVHKFEDAVLKENLSKFEIPNLIFAGTTVASGSAKAIITDIGMNTEFGKIADLTQSMKDEKSPLQKELDNLTKKVSIMAISIGVFIFIAAVFFVKDSIMKSFVFALGMIVAYIPEGLLPTVTLSLAMAVQRMAKEHALVKKLAAVETLGSTTVICSDKTGTLTQNEMTVSNLWLLEKEFSVTGSGYSSEGEVLLQGKIIKAKEDNDLNVLLSGASLCSNARIIPPNEDNISYKVLGDPTEACLGVVAKKAGIDIEKLEKDLPRIRELPFDSRRKRMTTVHKKTNDSTLIAYVKGAPKEVMELSSHMLINGEVKVLNEEITDSIMEANDRYARKGLRVLSVAYRLINKNDNVPASLSAYTPENIEKDLVFVGLIVMSDPPRPEVSHAVELCRKASIRIIMITGDYGLTAESIAKRVGIVKKEHPRIITGLELESLKDENLREALKDEVIFARVASEQKYRIVALLQELGEIVAVTGDGVNDAPALKKADIGVAMGISGTDVAKEAADMILTDDNFASIVKAVEAGRAVYSNIQKFILYILNSNMSEGIPPASFLFSKGLIPLPLTVMQILSVDLGTDMLPALGLGTELPEKGIMDKPPRPKEERLLNKNIFIKAFLWYGMIASVFTMFAYFYVNILNGWPAVPLASSGMVYRQATTMTLGAIVFCQVGAVINSRTEKQSVFKAGFFKNRKIIFGIGFEIVLLAALMYIPFLQLIFNTGPLGIREWLMLFLIPIPIVAIEELRKYIVRKKNLRKEVA